MVHVALQFVASLHPNNSNTINALFHSCQILALLLRYREN